MASMDLKLDDTAKAVVPILSCVLSQLCSRNDKLPFDSKTISKFHALKCDDTSAFAIFLRPPAINIADYLESGECFVLALIYIDRIIQTNPTFVVNSLNIHRLLITSVMLGAKFFDDQYFNNAYYAKVGGVPCIEINSLEVEFLFMTNFSLFVSTDQYTQYYTELHNHVQHSNCACHRQHIQVPQLNIPPVIYRSQLLAFPGVVPQGAVLAPLRSLRVVASAPVVAAAASQTGDEEAPADMTVSPAPEFARLPVA